MYPVSRRGGYSDRLGINTVGTEIQLHNFDSRTRIQLFNEYSRLYSLICSNCSNQTAFSQTFYKFILCDVYSQIIDYRYLIPDDIITDVIKETILNGTYDNVLTLIEAVAQHWNRAIRNDAHLRYDPVNIFDIFNTLFEREYIGYRFLGDIISPISDESEVGAINSALSNPYASVKMHLTKANQLLADREKPDYENSIKESISAVEALCEIITGIKGKDATLGSLLKKIENSGVEIHGSMKSAFEKLYGFTCDANGIRHAGDIGGPESTFEEAKFMLVACSAFINYLMGVSAKLK